MYSYICSRIFSLKNADVLQGLFYCRNKKGAFTLQEVSQNSYLVTNQEYEDQISRYFRNITKYYTRNLFYVIFSEVLYAISFIRCIREIAKSNY